MHGDLVIAGIGLICPPYGTNGAISVFRYKYINENIQCHEEHWWRLDMIAVKND